MKKLNLKSGFIPVWILIIAVLGGILVFGFINWQKSGNFFGFSPYKTVDLSELLSFANFYDSKKICTLGYYVQTGRLTILKVSLDEDEFTKSIWINNPLEEQIIFPSSVYPNKKVTAKICGHFESHRAGEFGNPSVWNHQLTVEKFETYGEPEIINNF